MKYNLHATTVNITVDGNKYSAFTYEIQCNWKDLKEVTNYIASTCKENNQTCAQYQSKYTNPNVFVNRIKKQNTFINKVRTIPIYGITLDAMSYLYKKLIKRENILDINTMSKMALLGRWNVYTNIQTFESEMKLLQGNILDTDNDTCKHNCAEVLTNFKPKVTFNTTIIFPSLKQDHPNALMKLSNRFAIVWTRSKRL